MTTDTLKSKNVTKNVSIPAAWWERLDAIVAECTSNEKIINRSDLIISALINNHDFFVDMETDLDLDPYSPEDLT